MSYTVYLSHTANPDIAGGYWSEKRPSRMEVNVETIDQASKLCCEFIATNDLGSGNWTGGQVFVGHDQVAHISYNGRVWAMEGGSVQQPER